MRFKYSGGTDYFITHILPFFEQYVFENQHSVMELYAMEIICTLVDIMFSEHVGTHHISNNFDLISLPPEIRDLTSFLDETFDLTSNITLTKPLLYNHNNLQYLNNMTYSCVYPKCIRSEPFHNITSDAIIKLRTSTLIQKYDIFVMGEVTERTNLRVGKHVDNFIDSLAYLRNCNVFVTSHSDWKYIALLCNCRNIVVYNSSQTQYHEYNPFDANILETSDLNTTEVYQFINNAMKTK